MIGVGNGTRRETELVVGSIKLRVRRVSLFNAGVSFALVDKVAEIS